MHVGSLFIVVLLMSNVMYRKDFLIAAVITIIYVAGYHPVFSAMPAGFVPHSLFYLIAIMGFFFISALNIWVLYQARLQMNREQVVLDVTATDSP